MVFIRLRAKHLSTYLFLITPTNTLTFHKREYIRHLEPAVMDDTIIEQREAHQANSVTLKKMIVEAVTPDTFNPPHHELSKTNPT